MAGVYRCARSWPPAAPAYRSASSRSPSCARRKPDQRSAVVVEGVQRLGLLRVPKGLGILAFGCQRRRHDLIGDSKVRIEFDRSPALRDRFVMSTGESKLDTEGMAERRRHRIALERLPSHADRLLRASGHGEVELIAGMVVHGRGVERACLFEVPRRGRPVPVVRETGPAQCDVGLGQPGVDLKRPCRRVLGFRHHVPRTLEVEKGGLIVGIGQPRIGQRKSRILGHGLVEVLDGPSETLRTHLVPVISALQVQLVRGAVVGVALRQALLLLDVNRSRNLSETSRDR